MIVPDPSAEVDVDFGDGSAPEHFFLGDIRKTDGSPWECCPREFLRRAIAALEEASGLQVIAAFEQEFVYTGNEDRPGDAYSLGAWRRQGSFGESFIAAIRAAGAEPDSFLPEYGSRQFEVTVKPAPALQAADRAVIAREMARAAAFRLGHRAIFSPMPAAEGVGNGVHIHFSLRDKSGEPKTLRSRWPVGLERGRRAVRRRRACASFGDLRHHGAVARLLFEADAEPLGADRDRHREAGSRRRASHLPRVCGVEEEGHRQGL
jgi:glutamine synthetase